MSAGMVGAAVCFVLAGCFFFIASIFAAFKEKAAFLMAGFNVLSGFDKEKRELYDQRRISGDARNTFLLWGAVHFAGGLFSLFAGFYFAAIAGAVWIVLLFREIKIYPDEAYKKYLL